MVALEHPGLLKAREAEWERQPENLPSAFQLGNGRRMPAGTSLLGLQLWKCTAWIPRSLNSSPAAGVTGEGSSARFPSKRAERSAAQGAVWACRRAPLTCGANGSRCDQARCRWWESRRAHTQTGIAVRWLQTQGKRLLKKQSLGL